MNNNLTAKLAGVLEKEYEYYCELNRQAVKKRTAIINNETEKLTELLQDDEEIISSLEVLEQERTALSDELAEIYNLEKDDLHFSELISQLPRAEHDRMDSLRDKFLQIFIELHRLNEENRVLVEEGNKINNFSIRALVQALEPDNLVYSRPGNSGGQSRQTHMVDKKG